MCPVKDATHSVETVFCGSRVPPFMRLCHSSGVQAWPYRTGPELIPEQSMWDLWENNWNWDRFMFKCFGFTPSF